MSNETGHLNRRSFKGDSGTGRRCGFTRRITDLPMRACAAACSFNPKTYKIYRNACPRNCYDTCSLKTWVRTGSLLSWKARRNQHLLTVPLASKG